MLETMWKLITSRPVKIFSTVLVALLGIYGSFFYEKKPQITFELTSNATVLDVRETLSKLTVIYDGTNLKENNFNLFLLNTRVSNKGSADILKSNFDDGEPLGFKINSGTILEPPTIIGDDHIRNNLKPQIVGNNTVTFSPVILNVGDAFEVKALLLVKNGETPTITPIGKIAGVQNLHLSEPFREIPNGGILYGAFHGNWKMQLVRAIFYFIFVMIFTIVSTVLIILPASFISEKVKKFAREKKVRKYRAAVNRRLSLEEEFLLSKYIEKSKVFDVFAELVTPRTSMYSTHPEYRIRLNHIILENDEIENIYAELGNAGLVLRDGPQVSVNPKIETQTKEFVTFVSEISTKKQGQ